MEKMSAAENISQSIDVGVISDKRLAALLVPMVAVIGVAAIVGVVATPYMAAATVAYGLMNVGLVNRRTPKIHARLMGSAIAIDLGIVLTLEVQRHAINTAIGFTLSPLQQAHIGMSSLATLLYFPVAILGWRRLHGRLSDNGRRWHLRLGLLAYIFRTLGFVLMFALLERTIK